MLGQGRDNIDTIRGYSICGLCLFAVCASMYTAFDIASFVAYAQPANPLAVEPRTGKLTVIGVLLAVVAVLMVFAAYQTQRKTSRHRTVICTWSLPFVLLLVFSLSFLWLVYYPIPRHGHHIDKFLLLTIVTLLWSACYAFFPEILQRFADSRIHGFLKVSLVNIVVFIILGETTMRLADPILGRSGLFGGKHTPADLRPHVEVSGSIKRSNSQGFRDKERTVEKAGNQPRILAIGDSFTWGAGVSYDQAFVTLLEERFQTEFPGLEIVNQGVPGWEPPQELHLLKNYGIRFNPDIVVLNFFVGNDIMRRRGAETERSLIVAGQSYYVHDNGNWVHDNIGPDRWFLYHNLNYLFRMGIRTLRKPKPDANVSGFEFSPLGRSRKEYLQESDERTDVYLRNYPLSVELSWIKTSKTLLELKEFLVARRIPFMMVLIPDQIQLDLGMRSELLEEVNSSESEYDFEKPQKLLMEWCDHNSVVCLDLLPVFRDHSQPASLYLRNDLHWSSAGHELATQVILPSVRAEVGKLLAQSSAMTP